MRRAYWAMTSYVDAKVGRLLATLDEVGAADDTLVVFTSDHGDSLGERGLFFKMSFFEWAVRVPLIVHAPFAFGPRRGGGANVSHLDLFPTLLEAGGRRRLARARVPHRRPLARAARRGRRRVRRAGRGCWRSTPRRECRGRSSWSAGVPTSSS